VLPVILRRLAVASTLPSRRGRSTAADTCSGRVDGFEERIIAKLGDRAVSPTEFGNEHAAQWPEVAASGRGGGARPSCRLIHLRAGESTNGQRTTSSWRIDRRIPTDTHA